MSACYNEIDPFAAQWLRNLIEQGHVAQGAVDTRSIESLRAFDVLEARQAHFFAGIGIWSHALRLAGVPDNFPLWTGSCPCQPFSIAGAKGGEDDERHLWPEWRRLIDECRPAVVFGEQVTSPDGRAWLDTVLAEMEALGYAVAAADLCAACVGAPHIRQRLFFGAVRLANPERKILQRWCGAYRDFVEQAKQTKPLRVSGGLGDSLRNGSRRHAGTVLSAKSESALEGVTAWRVADCAELASSIGGHWADADWLVCRPSKPDAPANLRAVEPGTFPLANGDSARMGKVRAYGNAIVPQVAATFVQAFLASI